MNVEKPAPKMRSSIACARCRRSKVKCINNGVNTPCKACEATGRECTYPPPATPGSRSTTAGSAATAGTPIVGGGTVGWHSANTPSGNGSLAVTGGATGGEKPRSRPKRPTHSASGSQAHLLQPRDGSSRPISEALDSNVLTPAVWSQTYDLLTLHYPHLPILHRPTFLRPLTEPQSSSVSIGIGGGISASVGVGGAMSTPPPNSTSSTPPPPPSPFLLLAILTLIGRFSPALIAHHTTTPTNTSEYYANALRSRLLSVTSTNYGSDDPDENGILVPSIAKVQALVMLGVHELGQSNGDRAWIWLGIAIRMCQLLDLPPNAEVQGKSPIEVESERRTWWAVVMLDRMLSSSGSGKGRAFAYGWERVRNVPLPCSERAWLFGDRVKVGSLLEPITILNQSSPKMISSSTEGRENGVHPAKNNDMTEETGADESVHARLIRLVDIWGRVCQYMCNQDTSNSNGETLNAELERWREDLPRALSYTHQNLQAHISAHTSSAYALLHILYYLCILLLHRETLPVTPTANPQPEPNKCFSAARKITEIAREMHTWLSLPLTPVVCFAVYCTAWVGIYGLHHPELCGPPGNAMGAGDAHFLLCIIEGWRPKWKTAEGWLRALAAEHAFLKFRKSHGSSSAEVNANRKRRWQGDEEENPEGMDIDSPGLGEEVSDEMKNFDKTLRELFALSIGSGPGTSKDGGNRHAKKPRSNIASSVGGDSDTEMGNITSNVSPRISNLPAPESAQKPTTEGETGNSTVAASSSAGSGADRWVAVNTSQRQDANSGIQGLIAAAQAGQQGSPQEGANSSNVIASEEAAQQAAAKDKAETSSTLQEIPSSIKSEVGDDQGTPHQQSTTYGRTEIAENVEPITPTTAVAAPVTVSKTDSSVDSTEPHDRDRFLFEGWGKRGIAKIDLVGFTEGKKWQEWGEGEDNWFSSGAELL